MGSPIESGPRPSQPVSLADTQPIRSFCAIIQVDVRLIYSNIPHFKSLEQDLKGELCRLETHALSCVRWADLRSHGFANIYIYIYIYIYIIYIYIYMYTFMFSVCTYMAMSGIGYIYIYTYSRD